MYKMFKRGVKYSVKEYQQLYINQANRELDMQSYAIKVITGMMMSGFAAMYLHVDKRFEQVDKRFEQVDNRFEHLEDEVKEIKGTLNDILLAVKKD